MARKKRRTSTAYPADIENTVVDDNVYELEDILCYRREKNGDHYLVKWGGYSAAESTWEPRSNIITPGSKLEQKMRMLKSEAEKRQSEQKAVDNRESESAPSVAVRKKTAKRGSVTRSKSLSSIDHTTNIVSPVDLSDEPICIDQSTDVPSTGERSRYKRLHISQIPDDPPVRVMHMRERQGEMEVRLRYGDNQFGWYHLSDARERFCQSILEYLLRRVRFRSRRPDQDDE